MSAFIHLALAVNDAFDAWVVGSAQGDADDHQEGTKGEEAEVPPEWVFDVVADVVDGEDVVVDDALDAYPVLLTSTSQPCSVLISAAHPVAAHRPSLRSGT